MAKAGAFVCLVIVIVDAAAGVLSIQAEIAKDKMIRYKRPKRFDCQDPNDQAFKLGLAAATLLALAHVTANTLGGCICICCTEVLERSSANRHLLVIFFGISCTCTKFPFDLILNSLAYMFMLPIMIRIVVGVGFPTLVTGLLENSKSKGSCQVLHHHFLFIGGIFCFVHGLLIVVFYVSATVNFDRSNHGLERDPS